MLVSEPSRVLSQTEERRPDPSSSKQLKTAEEVSCKNEGESAVVSSQFEIIRLLEFFLPSHIYTDFKEHIKFQLSLQKFITGIKFETEKIRDCFAAVDLSALRVFRLGQEVQSLSEDDARLQNDIYLLRNMERTFARNFSVNRIKEIDYFFLMHDELLRAIKKQFWVVFGQSCPEALVNKSAPEFFLFQKRDALQVVILG